MNKISVSQLEAARRSPSSFAKSLKNGTLNTSYFGGRPKSVRWLDAVAVYHSSGDISRAINALENSFSHRQKTPANVHEVEILIGALEQYANEHAKLGYVFQEKAHLLEIVLSSKLRIAGWIWILNMTVDGGRAGYIVTKEVKDISWQSELRFPVMQNYIANGIYGCDLKNVEVGLVEFVSGVHHRISYSDRKVEEAMRELTLLGKTLSSKL